MNNKNIDIFRMKIEITFLPVDMRIRLRKCDLHKILDMNKIIKITFFE